jgi:PKD repeat protein
VRYRDTTRYDGPVLLVLLGLFLVLLFAAGTTPVAAATASCSASPTTVTVNDTVTLDGSANNASYVQFDVEGDGTYDRIDETDFVIDTSYAEAGSYEPVLRAEDSNGQATASCGTVTVTDEDPTADFSYTPNSPDPGESVNFDSSPSTDDGQITGTTWRIDGEVVAERPQFEHTFSTEGTYTVSLTVRDEDGNQDEVSKDVTVAANEPPSASFTFTSQDPASGQQVEFDATGSNDPDGTIEEYRWDFDGDGTIDEATIDPTTTHTYSSSGDFVAVLTVEDGTGATGTTSRDISVTQSVDPVARCTAQPSDPLPGETVTLDASSSTSADTYRWDLDGDGTFDTDTYATPTFDTTYDDPGANSPVVRVHNTTTDETDTAPCGDLTTGEAENQPPTARFSPSPVESAVGENVSFDASASADPDGSIVRYGWDFDGDGVVDRNTTRATTEYPYGRAGSWVPTLVVTDDDGATDRTSRDVVVSQASDPTCYVEPTRVAPGEEVVVGASAGDGTTYVEFDVTGDGEFGHDDETDFEEPVSYDEPGTYDVSARIHREGAEPTTVDCGTVTVEGENLPPRADVDHDPISVGPNTQVTFNASNSWDLDGSVVEYRWDFGADGSVERTTSGPTVTNQYAQTGNYTVRVIVVDDDGATDSDEDRIPVRSSPLFGFPIPILPDPIWLVPGLAGGCAGGYAACRRRGGGSVFDLLGALPSSGSDDTEGVTAYATGTVETPTDGDTVTVTGLGFEPDALVFTATNTVSAADGPTRTDGWSYGKATRNGDGSLVQNVVSVADDARSADSAVSAARSGQVVDLLVHDDDRAGALAGSVTATTDDGFELVFDGSALPADHVDERYAVSFQAFETVDDADVNVGYFTTPTEPVVQQVDLGTDADYVQLTAVDPLGEMDAAAVTDGRVGVSHGAASREASTSQHAISGTVASAATGAPTYGAFDDRAIHLLHGDGDGDDGVAGRTTARVTGLGEQLELTYDAVDAPPAGAVESEDSAETGPAGDGDEQEPAAPPRLVTFVAVDTGDGPSPTVDHFEIPRAEESPRHVDVGFEPAMVECTASVAESPGRERTVVGSPLSFGWSHGTAMIDRAGTVDTHTLHSSLTAATVSASAPVETPVTRQSSDPTTPSATTSTGDDGRARSDGGVPGTDGAAESDQSTDTPDRPAGVAIAFGLSPHGQVLGRDEVRLTAVDATGFTVESDWVGPPQSRRDARRPVVFYTAWPRRDGGVGGQ